MTASLNEWTGVNQEVTDLIPGTFPNLKWISSIMGSIQTWEIEGLIKKIVIDRA